MTITYLPPLPKTEHGLTQALLKYFEWQVRRCYPNVHLFPWESDLLVVSNSGYVTEVEVKVDINDWRHDAQKSKWQPDIIQYGALRGQDANLVRGWQYVKNFYYAVPAKLIAQMPDLPPGAGVLVMTDTGRIREHLKAEPRRAQPITEEHQHRLNGSMYHRFHQLYRKKKDR